MTSEIEPCGHMKDWDDFDADWDLRIETAMPHCDYLGRRVVPVRECGPTKCIGYCPASSLSFGRIAIPVEGSARDQLRAVTDRLVSDRLVSDRLVSDRLVSDRLYNLIQVKLSDDEAGLKMIFRLKANGFWSVTTPEKMSLPEELKERMALLHQMAHHVNELGNCRLASDQSQMTAQYVQQHVRELFASTYRSIHFRRTPIWSYYATEECRKTLPRLREVARDLESAYRRYCS